MYQDDDPAIFLGVMLERANEIVLLEMHRDGFIETIFEAFGLYDGMLQKNYMPLEEKPPP